MFVSEDIHLEACRVLTQALKVFLYFSPPYPLSMDFSLLTGLAYVASLARQHPMKILFTFQALEFPVDHHDHLAFLREPQMGTFIFTLPLGVLAIPQM